MQAVDYAERLSSLTQSKQLRVGVIGMGYVGLPLALAFSENGIRSVGYDIDSHRVESINKGISYFSHIDSSRIKENISTKQLKATDQISDLGEVDVIIICVPTPLTKNREPDLSYIKDSISSFTPYLRKGQLLCLESTTYPGTTDEILVSTVESAGFHIGQDLFIAYSPEREDPGNKKILPHDVPKVIGGYTKQCATVASEVYLNAFKKTVIVTSTRAAEMVKLLENIHRAVNIGLVNELKIITSKMSLDIYEIIEAASTKPFGFVPYFPGPGLGGHCIPIDPFYLTWKSKEFDINTKLIELAGEINSGMPQYVVDILVRGLNDQHKAVKGSKILVLGVAYKKNIDDTRESPSFPIIKKILEMGGIVSYSDPYVQDIARTKVDLYSNKSIRLTPDTIKEYDAVVLSTDHDIFDYELISKNARLIIDARGRFRKAANIIRA